MAWTESDKHNANAGPKYVNKDSPNELKYIIIIIVIIIVIIITIIINIMCRLQTNPGCNEDICTIRGSIGYWGNLSTIFKEIWYDQSGSCS